ncbi:13399_t:CDS:2, partial [Funneliformis geosporum]
MSDFYQDDLRYGKKCLKLCINLSNFQQDTITEPENNNMSISYGSPFQTSNSMYDFQNYNQGYLGYAATAEPYNSGSSQSGESYEEAKLAKKNKGPRCKWEVDPTLWLLCYLIANKESVLELKKRGSTAGKVRKLLWKGASFMLYNIYSEEQCANRWKNIKQNNK